MNVLRENVFFSEKRNVFLFFRLLSGELSYLGVESPTDCQKCIWSVSRFFFQDYLFSENFFNSLLFSLINWAQLFRKHEKMDFWREEISTVFITGFHASREIFAEFSNGKKPLQKRFRNLGVRSLYLVQTFRQIREKRITASRWTFRGNISFSWKKLV